MEPMTPLGKKVQDRRSELGLTLAELSERSGLLPQTINAIERGASRQPRHDTLYRLATALEDEDKVSEYAILAYDPAVPA